MKKTSTAVRDATVGAMILAAVLLLAYMATRIGTVAGFRGGREVAMVFDDATGLVETAPMAASGVKVGTVTTIRFADGGALVRGRISPDVELHADATATVRSKSLLGEKFVSIDPGTEAAGPLPPDARIRTVPSADIERMAAAFARAAEAMDPEDVRAIVHGLAVALSSDDGEGTIPEAVRSIGADLHRLSVALEQVAGRSGELMKDVQPLLAELDRLAGRAGKSMEQLDPTLKRLPSTLDQLERVSRRLETVLAKADALDQDQLLWELRKILEEEGIYVRVTPRKVGKPPADQPPTKRPAPRKAPEPPPGLSQDGTPQ